jgi:very-long-chain enoyl-CoA reductase
MAAEEVKLDVCDVRSSKLICRLDGLSPHATVLHLKNRVRAEFPQLYPERQQFKISQDRKAKAVKDHDTLQSLGITSCSAIYFKDLGPQVGWSTVFLTEYAGPLVVYLLFYPRPALLYGGTSRGADVAVHVAMICWTLHYGKRLLETLFVHRFSHTTMPLRNLFKNCSYYWGFAAFVSYFVNHPLYSPPSFGTAQMVAGLTLFLVHISPLCIAGAVVVPLHRCVSMAISASILHSGTFGHQAQRRGRYQCLHPIL